MDPSSQREFPRAPISVKVNLEFEKFSGFISEYSTNISEGGIFIRTDDPKPIGTVLSFEFRLADNFKLIQGLGEVVWLREQSLSPTKPKGMGIQFHELDSRSRELIRTIVDRHIREGGRPFQLETEAPPSPPAAAEIPPAPAAPDASLDHLFQTPAEAGTSPARPPTEDTAEIQNSGAGVEDDFRALFKAGEADPPTGEKPPRIDMGIVMEEEPPPPMTDLTERLEPESTIFSSDPESGGKLKWILIAVAGVLIAGAVLWFFFLRKPETVRVPPRRVTVAPTVAPAAAATVAPSTTAVPATEPTAAPSAPEQPTLAPPTPVPSTPEPVPATPTPIPPPTPPPAPESTVAPTVAAAPPTVAPPTPKAPPVILSGALITQITWTQSATETVFRLSSDREITFDQVQHVRITEEPAREVIKIRGVRGKFRAPRMNVSGPHVKQIRTGFHVFPGRGELHVVFDLTSPRAQITKVDTSPSGVLVRFENR